MKYFLDTSFIMGLININDSLHSKSLNLGNIIFEDCYINKNVLNEVLTLSGRKLNIDAAREVYYSLLDNFTVINEYEISNYESKTFNVFETYVGANSKKTKLSFTDSSIIVSMREFGIENLVSFDKEFKKVNGINLIQ